MRLLIVGFDHPAHVGTHFCDAAQSLGLTATIADTQRALRGPPVIRSLAWRLRGHRPYRLKSFGDEVIRIHETFRPDIVLATGIAPLTETVLKKLKQRRAALVNFLTDDPWNPAHLAAWFLKALPAYDFVFTPRHANMDSLRRLGCHRVQYLPFAYAPRIHYRQPLNEEENARFYSDVFFAGAADKDRLPYAGALLRSGLKVGLFGQYWERHLSTRFAAGGVLAPDALRCHASAAAVTLCITRRANQDGHAMRSFELPAMRTCLLTEDTPDHRRLFGPDGEATVYFDSPVSMADRCLWLMQREEERDRLAFNAHRIIVGGQNTYADRLQSMLTVLGVGYRELQSGGYSLPPERL